jgi:hypothetical protein
MTNCKIFISYASEDRLRATRLYTELKEAGASPWIDHVSLHGGQRWYPQIKREIQTADYFLVVLSENYTRKLADTHVKKRKTSDTGFVRQELNDALEEQKNRQGSESFFIPVRVEQCQVKDKYLKQIHFIDLFPDWYKGFVNVLKLVDITQQQVIQARENRSPGLRIATFNLCNFDDHPYMRPTLDERIEAMRPQLEFLDADILCLQEINAQEPPNYTTDNPSRNFMALDALLKGTNYAKYARANTITTDGIPFYQRNLVTLSRFQIVETKLSRSGYMTPATYQIATAIPKMESKSTMGGERPSLYTKLKLNSKTYFHVINSHLKSPIPANIQGQYLGRNLWRSPSGWAEGHFISSMKRTGQAMDVRLLIDEIFDSYDSDGEVYIAVCGSLNSEVGEDAMEIIRGEPKNVTFDSGQARSMVPAEAGISDAGRFTTLNEKEKCMTDNILVSFPLIEHYRFTEIHNTYLEYNEDDSTVTPYSDHAPVIAEFRLFFKGRAGK